MPLTQPRLITFFLVAFGIGVTPLHVQAQRAGREPVVSFEIAGGASPVTGGQYRDRDLFALRVSGSAGALLLLGGGVGLALSYEIMSSPQGVTADCLVPPSGVGCVPWDPEVKGMSGSALWSRRTSPRTLVHLGAGLGTYELEAGGRSVRRVGAHGHADGSVQLIGPIALSGAVRALTFKDPAGARVWYLPVTIGLRLQAPFQR